LSADVFDIGHDSRLRSIKEVIPIVVVNVSIMVTLAVDTPLQFPHLQSWPPRDVDFDLGAASVKIIHFFPRVIPHE